MMNLSRKRSASPLEPEGETSPLVDPLTMNYDQLSALHYAKRLRLAQAQAAAMAAEAALYRPTMMDLYGSSLSSSSLAFPSAAGRLSPYYSPTLTSTLAPSLSSSAGLGTGHPLAWRRAAMEAGMPVLPVLPGQSAATNSAPRLKKATEEPEGILQTEGSFDENPFQDHQDNLTPKKMGTASLEQLSAFASHLPTMPVVTKKIASGTSSSSSVLKSKAHKKKKTTANMERDLYCVPTSAPSSSSSSAMDRPATYCKTIENKGQLPVPDPDTGALYWADRAHVPLAIDEDPNWLSEFQCFIRNEILEVFIASPFNKELRNSTASSKKLADNQIGLRCRFCAHLYPTERAPRSSAFPSSVRQIYQSFTMMLREHWSGQCEALPEDIATQLIRLKGQSAQSASDSKRYWVYAAQKLGMVDTPDRGIQMTQDSIVRATASSSAFGSSPDVVADIAENQAVELVTAVDKPITNEWVYAVVSQAQLIHLAASEKIGNRSCLTVGLPGLACRHCCNAQRSGLARVFPARKRNLKNKVQDLYDHLRRCCLVPVETRERLVELHREQQQQGDKSRVFLARLWKRLGHVEETVLEEPQSSAELTTTATASSADGGVDIDLTKSTSSKTISRGSSPVLSSVTASDPDGNFL